VKNLFQNQEDLLAEFSQFLPEASAYTSFSLGGPPPSKKQAVGTGVTKTAKGTRKVRKRTSRGLVLIVLGLVWGK